ncbi:hypothetical protein VOLCADRAFT_107041 [Volvox carteri f. nagariensis]|uniref:Splicing factor YJU2 n=1 Tax=Volvox carteri f. nagariensis TaxID=3068 RepID=D8UBG6_VOLCA|nr:uncharacterized protein VOLCADRAFT_107041 [Volvox carteri f. nagariensis]EFJ43002.1 hypothetical protein VOLCADRAFT_107041 [Volvox carteri f. nagariensis]|eukprot:XP_002956042.1 hypothetical protein VOLCADRAFT_107041 [Volvox carteri f. nagariensis]
MGERKVLNKYFPPDFDPAKLPKGKRRETNEMKVRMMLPMSVRCKTCGVFMYKGTKFNTRKEDVMGENYLGIQVFRFYYRCKKCAAEFCMKTDPKSADYILEAGATRNYEPWRDEEATKAEAVAKREEEEMGNAMKALENRTLDSKREMDIMAALDEMKALNAQHAKVTTEQALEALQKAAAQQQLDEDDVMDVAEFYQLRAQANTKRLEDSGEEEDEDDEGRERERGGPSGRSGRAGASAAGQGPSSAAGLSDLSQMQQQAAAGIGGARAGAAATASQQQQQTKQMKPSIKVMVKPKAPLPAASATVGAAGAAAPQGAAEGSGSALGKRPVLEIEGGNPGNETKKQNVGAEQAPALGGGLTGMLGQYGSSGSDSDL